jgi:hypothetical protein
VNTLQPDIVEAISTGEILTVVYHGGSQPGTKRQISPIKITTGKVYARDLVSGSVKWFAIEKLEIVDADSPVPPYRLNARELDKSDFLPFLSAKIEELKSLGWHIELSDLSVSAHRPYKNGKIRKGADTGIHFRAEAAKRPWYVWGPGLESAKTFSDLASAISAFIDQATKYAPTSRA